MQACPVGSFQEAGRGGQMGRGVWGGALFLGLRVPNKWSERKQKRWVERKFRKGATVC